MRLPEGKRCKTAGVIENITRMLVCSQDGLKRVSAFNSHTLSLSHTQLVVHSKAPLIVYRDP